MSQHFSSLLASRTQPLWTLVGQTSEHETVRDVPVLSFPFHIGRKLDAHLRLEYPTISSSHAKILRHGDQLWVRDLRSTNGTFLNGKRLCGSAGLNPNDLLQFADVPFRLKRSEPQTAGQTTTTLVVEYALALVQLDTLMSTRAFVPCYQPIVDLRNRAVMGYEVLGRSDLVGLETPHAMFQAAAQLRLEVDLSRCFREEGVRLVASRKPPIRLFVNTHPLELQHPDLTRSLSELRNINHSQPIVLEIHESADIDVTAMRRLRETLDELNIQLAYDDLGAGQDRLGQLFEVRPDYVKFDMALIRNIDQAPASRLKMLTSFVSMVTDLGITTIAEGIETEGELAACRHTGFQFAQGFLLGKPLPPTQIPFTSQDY